MVLDRRLRLRLPLRLSVLTLGHLHVEDGLHGLADLDLVGVGRDDEGVDVAVEQRVGLLRHHRPQDDVAGILAHCSSPASSSLAPPPPPQAAREPPAGSPAEPRIPAWPAWDRSRRRGGPKLWSDSASGSAGPPFSARAASAASVSAVKTTQSAHEHVVGVQLVHAVSAHPVAEVAERLPGRLVIPGQDDQGPILGLDPEAVERLAGLLGLGRGEAPGVDHHHVTSAARSDRAERRASHTIFLGVRWR